jgi:hypothetical protein
MRRGKGEERIAEMDTTTVLTGITAGEGDMVSARLPTPAEAAALGMEPWAGVPIIAITRSTGTEELFDARRVQVVAK